MLFIACFLYLFWYDKTYIRRVKIGHRIYPVYRYMIFDSATRRRISYSSTG